MIALIGGVSGYFEARDVVEPAWWFWTSTILLNVTIFMWYYRDSSDRSFVRSRWLNVGVVALAPVAISIYVLRRSPSGTHLRVTASLFGYLVLILVVGVLASFAGGLLG